MIRIKDLLNKIKWDEREKKEDYTIGYEDRKIKKIIEIPFAKIEKVEDNFMLLHEGDVEVNIPTHRIRIVKKGGKAIWER